MGPVTGPVRPVGPRDYALAPAVRARLLGVTLAVIGGVVLVAALVITPSGTPVSVLTGLVVLAALGVVAAGLALGPRRYVLRLDETGYRIRVVRGVGRDQARWTDVLDLTTAVVSGTECVVLRLRDGRTTTIPVAAVSADKDDFARDVREHVQRGQAPRPR